MNHSCGRARGCMDENNQFPGSLRAADRGDASSRGVRAEEGAIPLPKRAASPPRNPHYPNREALILPSHSGAALYSRIRASP
jgi:hypothetical protein